MTPDDAKVILSDGNRAFSTMLESPDPTAEAVSRAVPIAAGDPDSAGSGSSLQQTPFAVVVGCADARVPIELIFGQRSNALFVLRVAGPVLGEEILGSIDFALQNLPTIRLIVVLGHSQCGAVTAATNAFLDPAAYLGLSADHRLRSIVNKLFPAVRLAHASMLESWGSEAPQNPGFVPGLAEAATAINAALIAASLRSELSAHPEIDARPVFGVYDMGTRSVDVPGASWAGESEDRLLDPPTDADGFTALGLNVATGPTVAALMRP
jgi:carbonic anhydrase